MSPKPITVLGSFMADLVCRADRMPAWGETLRGNAFAVGPGGKGSNQAIAAARQGATVNLISRLGRDAFGDMARNIYRDEGMNTAFISDDPDRSTGTASIVVDDARGENAIIIVPGACDGITEDHVTAAADAIAGSALFISQLELPLAVCRRGMALARENGVPVLLNPAPGGELPRDMFQSIDYLTPNESEASALVGQPVNTMAETVAAAAILHGWGVPNVLITLGEKGVYVSSADFEGVIPAVKAGPVVETTGAGDAFNGGLATALAEGRSLADAARFGNAVAGISVTRPGAALAMPRRQEVDRLLAAGT
ncbi:MAG: ribokinase [Oleiphilaceae bacterium]|nr:ribokinase [Oleiphilaceae bacterium]